MELRGVGWDGMCVVFGAWMEIRSCGWFKSDIIVNEQAEYVLESVLTYHS